MEVQGYVYIYIYLVGGDWKIFSIQLGMSSSQLTHIVQRGRLNHQPDLHVIGENTSVKKKHTYHPAYHMKTMVSGGISS